MGYILTFIVTSIVPVAWLLLRGLVAGVVTYYGLDLLIDFLGDKLQDNFDGMPVAMYQMMSLMGIPKAINIALSFVTTIMVIKGSAISMDGLSKAFPSGKALVVCSDHSTRSSTNSTVANGVFWSVEKHGLQGNTERTQP